MSFETIALRLGVGYQCLRLERGAKRRWRHAPTDQWSSVESAAATHFLRTEGWSGGHHEGGLILSLLKAASFIDLPYASRSTLVEALYNQHVTPKDRPAYRIREEHEVALLVETVRSATRERIRANFGVMATESGVTPSFFPKVTLAQLEGLFEALGVDRLHALAKIFATAPYDLRAGWPDLTLWRDDRVVFWEIKTSGDTFHASQERLIRTVAQPLGLEVSIVEVVPAHS